MMMTSYAAVTMLLAVDENDQRDRLAQDVDETSADLGALLPAALFFVRSHITEMWPVLPPDDIFPPAFRRRATTLLHQYAARVYRRSYRAALDTLGVVSRPADVLGLDALEKRLDTSVTSFIDTMTRHVRDRLRGLAQRGASRDEMRRELERLFVERFRTTHVRRLARTEMAYADNAAMRTAASVFAPGQALVWRAADAPNVCRACRARHNTVQVDSPPLHPNCRCHLVPEGR